MMQRFLLLFIWVMPLTASSQWPSFNEAIPISIQSPPFNYLQSGGFQNVFQTDLIGTQQDGYLTFGYGALESPSVTWQYQRAFGCKMNVQGSPMWWRRFENDSLELCSGWINFQRGQGMIQDESGRIHSTYTDWDVTITEPWNRSKDYIMVLDHNAEIVSQTRIWHDTTHAFGYSGLLYDEGDDTHVLYGSWRDSAMYFANSFPDAFLSKVAADGEILWEKHYPNTFGVWHVVKAMDGGYWILANEANGYCEFNFVEPNDDLV
ncbi:MAG: hypothetical protein ACK57W_00350, partial [Flavobacteriales bacterium]